MTRFWWGEGKQDGSFYPMLADQRGKQWLFSFRSYGKVEIPFTYVARTAPFGDIDLRKTFLRRLNDIPGIQLPADAICGCPRIETSELTDPGVLDQLIQVLEWAAHEIESTR